MTPTLSFLLTSFLGSRDEKTLSTMKNLNKIAFLLGLCCIGFTACSDEENGNEDTPTTSTGIHPSNVFVNGCPKEAEDMSFVYNAEGLLIGVSENGGATRVSFDYSTLDQSKVQMIVYDDYGTYVLDMALGSNGFVTDCVESAPDGTDTWEFDYTSSGNLNYMKRSEGGDEETRIVYNADGDIVQVMMNSEDEHTEYVIGYTNDEITTSIENKGCLMLFDTTFGIDMDEMKYAYYAGLLGKATQHLPLYQAESGYRSSFEWSFNADGFPVSLVAGYERMEFVW